MKLHKLTPARLIALKAEFGADALAGLSGGRSSNEEQQLFAKLISEIAGSENLDCCTDLKDAEENAALAAEGISPLNGPNNLRGARDMGVRPGKCGRSATEIMKGASAGEIKGLFILDENPMHSDFEPFYEEAALKRLDFLAVQDIFLTKTAALADVVLPTACFAEKDGSFTNAEGRVQPIRKAVSAPGEELLTGAELARQLPADNLELLAYRRFSADEPGFRRPSWDQLTVLEAAGVLGDRVKRHRGGRIRFCAASGRHHWEPGRGEHFYLTLAAPAEEISVFIEKYMLEAWK